MKRNNILVFDQNYGLWYDRRRNSPVKRIRQRDGGASRCPFYEQPFDLITKYCLGSLSKYKYEPSQCMVLGTSERLRKREVREGFLPSIELFPA